MTETRLDLTRRAFFSTAAASLACGATAAKAEDVCSVFDVARQQATTPDEALHLLQGGNRRFATGKSLHCDLIAEARSTAKAQAPMAAIVGCIDSRVSPELVFDQHIGDIFAARIAGNFVNLDIIGSLEFATKVAGAKAIIVVGHTGCGAVMGAIDGVKLGHLTEVLRQIEPAIAAAGISGADRTSKNSAAVLKVTEANAKLAAANLVERSDILRELVEAKSLKIAAAIHDLQTGVVRFI